MKIELSDYFKDKFRSAYLFENNKGRRVIELVPLDKTHGKKRFISFAKYLWISNNNREVPYGFEIDHIDNDPRNDVIDNLQLLSKRDNIIKAAKFRKHPEIKLVCPVCGKVFYKGYRYRNRVEQGKTTCSHSCSAIFNPCPPNPKKRVMGTNITTGETRFYDSTFDVRKDGFCQQHVSKCCNNKAKTHKGFTWNFI